MREDIVGAGEAALFLSHAGESELVVPGSLVGVAQNIVGFGRFLEF